MKRLVVVCLVIVVLLTGCKSKAWYEGTWYLVQNPESEDGWITISGDKFAMDKASGEVMEVEDGIVITSLIHGSDKAVRVKYNGVDVLLHESDGFMYVKGKEKAWELHRELIG